MEHVPTTESDVEKVYRIARELGIGLEEAAVTCDAFHLAFSDERLRRSIFGMIDELDESAWKKGEPLGLIIRYTVELGEDGIRVGRYADEIPPGEVVSLTPTNRAMILLKIKDNFPTQEFLGPLIVNRPDPLADEHFSARSDVSTDIEIDELPSLAKEGWQPVSADGVVCSDSETEKPAILLGPSSLESPAVVICLGPIRLKFNERFPIVSATASETVRTQPTSCFGSPRRRSLALPLAVTASHPGQWISGLSPPYLRRTWDTPTERCSSGIGI